MCWWGLAEASEAPRAEMTRAMGASAGTPMRFGLYPIELTVQVALTDEGSGKIGWKVIEFGRKTETITTQSLALRLTPKWRDADGTHTADFTIAGAGAPGQHFGPTYLIEDPAEDSDLAPRPETGRP
jgi:hypothetical protein